MAPGSAEAIWRQELIVAMDVSATESVFVRWISDGDLAKVGSSAYWNDENEEKRKEFDIRDGHAEKLESYLKKETTYWKEFHDVLSLAGKAGRPIGGVGVDIAAGVCWTTALLSRVPAVERIYAVDISFHRLQKLAPLVGAMFDWVPAKVVRVLGSFYHLRLPDQSVDFVFMSQAFHHADHPQTLLKELRRVLREEGLLLVIGESPVRGGKIVWRGLKNAVKRLLPARFYGTPPVRKWFPAFHELFPPDAVLGDRHYRPGDYRKLLGEEGFELHAKDGELGGGFWAVKRSELLSSGRK